MNKIQDIVSITNFQIFVGQVLFGKENAVSITKEFRNHRKFSEYFLKPFTSMIKII